MPEKPPAGRRDRTPNTDWTGIQFKAPADLAGPDYQHVGRESTAWNRR